MADTAFEAIVSRQAWHTAAILPPYHAVMVDSDGLFNLSDGSGPFVGIVQYGAEAAGDIATVVKGSFPAIATVDVDAGDALTINSAAAGKFKKAAQADTVYGVALTSAAAGDLFTLYMSDVAIIEP